MCGDGRIVALMLAGRGASNLNGNNGAGAACGSGDCAGVLNCVNTVRISPWHVGWRTYINVW